MMFNPLKASNVTKPLLPPGWVEQKSRSGTTFYANSITGVKTKTLPALEEGGVSNPLHASAADAAPPVEPALPSGWSKHVSRSSGKAFYTHADGRKQSSPPEMGGTAQPLSTINEGGSRSGPPPLPAVDDVGEDALPPGWTKHTSRTTGKSFFMHTDGRKVKDRGAIM